MPPAPPNQRDAILKKVRQALSKPTDEHVKSHTLHVIDHSADASPAPGAVNPPPANEGQTAGPQRWLPPGGDTHEERIDRFAAFSEKLKTRFEVVANHEAATERIKQIASEEQWQSVGVSGEPIVQQCLDALDLPAVQTDGGTDYDRDALEACSAGITGCEALIAQTGSVLVTAAANGGRTLSVLPPHHVVLATADQMLEHMADGYAHLRIRYEDKLPSQITFITGPSRTGDIERILVLGAHGPKKLTVLLIDPDSL